MPARHVELHRPYPPGLPNLFARPTLGIIPSYTRITRDIRMKPDIHPVYATATVRCACGNTYQTRSTQAEIHTDICAQCHPFFTGKQKLVDTAGRVERFRQKYGKPAAAAPSTETGVSATGAGPRRSDPPG